MGLSDVSPLDETPALTNYVECAYYEGPMGNGETKTFQCNGGHVIGRYLIVQLENSEVLTLCEVEVEGIVGRYSFPLSIHISNVAENKSNKS